MSFMVGRCAGHSVFKTCNDTKSVVIGTYIKYKRNRVTKGVRCGGACPHHTTPRDCFGRSSVH